MRNAYFNPQKLNIGDDDSGRAWQNMILGIADTKSKLFNSKMEDSAANFLLCNRSSSTDSCDLIHGFGQDLGMIPILISPSDI